MIIEPFSAFFIYVCDIFDEQTCSVSKVQDKRKASMDNLMQQPPLKKLATDGPMGVLSANPMPIDMPGASGVYAKNMGVPSMVRSFSNETVLGTNRRRDMIASQGYKTTSVLDQAWKDDMEVRKLLPLLYENFGESMFNFVPAPALSFFL